MKLDAHYVAALEQVDADAWESMCRAVPDEVAQTLKLWVGRYSNVVATRCLVSDTALTNRVTGLGCNGQPVNRELLASLVADYKATGLKNFAFQMGPNGSPAFCEALANLGLVVRSHNVKLFRGREALRTPEKKIDVRLMQAEDKRLFGETSALGWGRPPIIAHWMGSTVGDPNWRHYLAYVDGAPAGVGACYINGKVAWLGIGSVLPEFRQQGVQQALIARRLEDGLALGVECFVSETESHNISCANMIKAGFEVAYERPNYGVPLEV